MVALQVTNFDTSVSITEDATTVAPAKAVAEEVKQDLLYEHSAHKAHRDESDAIHDLTNMVMKLVVETPAIRNEMEKTITGLTDRVTALEKVFVDLKGEINQRTGHDLDKEFADIKDELFSLSSVANEDTAARTEKLKTLSTDLQKIKQGPEMDHHLERLTQTHNKVLETLNSGHRWSFMISCVAIVLILFAGLALYQKFRKWEKKHIL